MKNPGSILIVFLTLCTGLYAGVKAELSRDNIALGEKVILRLHVDGESIEEPSISKLCDSKIISTSRSTNMQITNGSYTKEQVLSYSFTPLATCKIEPITVKVDGKYESTAPLSVTVSERVVTKDSPFILTMKAEKSSVFVGEPLKVTINLKQRHNTQTVDSKFALPKLKNFWIKEQQQGRRFEEGNYTVSTVTYIMAAQKSGKQHIDRTQLQVAQRTHSRDAWGQWFPQLQWRSYFSNELDIDVKPLPGGVNLVGDFKITATLDKNEVAVNDAVNLTLRVSGSGNFEDIGSLKPSIDGVNVFEEDASTKAFIEKGVYRGVLQQKIALVSDHDYTIPPIALRYFDPKSKTIKTVSTKALHVSIKGAAKKERPLKIERSSDDTPTKLEHKGLSSQNSTPNYLWIISLVAGVVLGVLIMLIPWKNFRADKEFSVSVNIRDEKSVLNFLLNFIDDAEVNAMVKQLEAKLYEGKNITIDKKQLKVLLKRHKLF